VVSCSQICRKCFRKIFTRRLAEEEKQAVKAHTNEAVSTVKKLILEFNLAKGDSRGDAVKKLEV